jgi:hypothetical protein
MSKDKTKEFTNFIKKDFDIVKDYKNASKELTPKEAFEIIEEVMTANMPPNYLSDELHTISKTLTDYTKQTEMLVELREKMASHVVVNLVTSYDGKPDCKLCKSLFELGETATYVPTFEDIILQDINTILEGGK